MVQQISHEPLSENSLEHFNPGLPHFMQQNGFEKMQLNHPANLKPTFKKNPYGTKLSPIAPQKTA